jgi:hypothetical protein
MYFLLIYGVLFLALVGHDVWYTKRVDRRRRAKHAPGDVINIGCCSYHGLCRPAFVVSIAKEPHYDAYSRRVRKMYVITSDEVGYVDVPE